MIPTSTVTAFIIAGICTLVLPFVLIIVLGIMKKIKPLPLLLGALAFFISQIVLRIPIFTVFAGQSWYRDFAAGQYVLFVLFLGLTAGLFEETARLGGALLLRKRGGFRDVISFGLGHGLCEVVLIVGIAHINNIVYSLAINGASGALESAMTPEVLSNLTERLATADPFHVCLGVLERVSAVIFHMFATALVFRGVKEKKARCYLLAIAAHTVFNAGGVFLLGGAGLVVTQIVLFIAALGGGYYVLKSRDKETPSPA